MTMYNNKNSNVLSISYVIKFSVMGGSVLIDHHGPEHRFQNQFSQVYG